MSIPGPAPLRQRSPACSRCRGCGGSRSAAPRILDPVRRRQQIDDRVAGQVAAFQQHRRARPSCQQRLGGAPHGIRVGDRDAGQRLGLRQVGSDDRRERQQATGQRGDRAGASSDAPPLATITGSHHDRNAGGTPRSVHRQTASMIAASPSMPVLTASAPISSSTDRDLLAHEIRRDRLDAVDAARVLCGQRGDRGRGVAAERGDRLDVGLDAGPAARVRAGDDQHPAGRITATISAGVQRRFSPPRSRSGVIANSAASAH